MQPKFQRKKAPPRQFFCQIKRETPLLPEWRPPLFTFPLSRGYAFPPFRRPAAAGGEGERHTHGGGGLPPPGGGGKRGQGNHTVPLPPFAPRRGHGVPAGEHRHSPRRRTAATLRPLRQGTFRLQRRTAVSAESLPSASDKAEKHFHHAAYRQVRQPRGWFFLEKCCIFPCAVHTTYSIIK